MGLSWIDRIDNVDDVVAEDINTLAHSVINLEENLFDSGWQSVAADQRYATVYYRKINKQVEIFILCDTGRSLEKDQLIGILPEGFRPSRPPDTRVASPLVSFYIKGNYGTAIIVPENIGYRITINANTGEVIVRDDIYLNFYVAGATFTYLTDL